MISDQLTVKEGSDWPLISLVKHHWLFHMVLVPDAALWILAQR